MADGIKTFSDSFVSVVDGFKLSELMLFFARYKAGCYDNSFSTFDTKRIGNAFRKEFIPERNRELDRAERKRQMEAVERRRFVPPAGYSSLSWYRHVKKLADAGDEEAIALLKSPER